MDSSSRPVHLTVKTVLFDPGQVIGSVHFPIDGVVSLVTPLADGNIVEVATIGNEGIVGVPHVAGGSLSVRAISQVGAGTLRMDAALFDAELEGPSSFRRLVQRHIRRSSARSHRRRPATGCTPTRSASAAGC